MTSKAIMDVINTYNSDIRSMINYMQANIDSKIMIIDNNVYDNMFNINIYESMSNFNKNLNILQNEIIKNKNLFTCNIVKEYNDYFKKNFDLDPSTGIKGLQYIINTNEYNKILLVGIDNFKKGEQTYYFDINDINPSLKKYIGKAYTKDGIYKQTSGHDPDKTEIYLNSLKTSYPDIEIKNINN